MAAAELTPDGRPAAPVAAEHRYRLAAAIRPLLFWVGAKNVGGARIVWREDGGLRQGYELLLGSDPSRAPGADFAAWREGGQVRAVSGDGGLDPLDRPQHRYPDLRARVERGLRSHVVHPVSAVVSLADGWPTAAGCSTRSRA